MKRILSILVLVCFTIVLQAQEISKYDLEERAEHYFSQQRYDRATTDYEMLYNMYPKDAHYAYYLGRCYLHSNRYLDRACELLKFSATRNFGDDSYFYLGQAYHLNYNFEDAALSFITFQKTASSRTLKNFDVEYYISQTTNARQSVEVAQDLKIENLLVVPAHAVESAFKENIAGKYIYVPDQFRSARDKETNYESLMFLPENIEVGDYIFFSCQSKNSKQGSEIYSARRVSESDYSLPSPLTEEINSDFDEAYPYFDKTSSTLYFSSKGHNTSGGFDIFRSKYNPEDNSWSTAEKLAFPINSVQDDFLYTPLTRENEIMFVTNRNSGLKDFEAYTVEVVNPGEYISTSDKEQVLTLALLSPSSITIDAPLVAMVDEQLAAADEGNIEEEMGSDASYASLIKEALELQALSDSLEAVSKGLRIKVREINSYQKKQELVANITTLDKESKRIQLLADAKFQSADQLRDNANQVQLAENKVEGLSSSESTSSGITVFTYDTAEPVIKEEEIKEDKQTYEKGYAAAAEMGKELAASFSIMSSSPYSNNNPIPMASIPGGLVYRIQLGAYTQDIPESTFGGLAPVSKQDVNTATKYYVGEFGSIVNARDALDKVKAYGYPDAFLVSFYNQNKISVQKAREIEFADR